jgi:O-antigen biosynthesis protein WbqV
MIRLAGLRPDIDVKIAFTGLRPGEKLYEELLHVAESLMPTAYKDILLAAPRTADAALLARAIDELAEHARAGHASEVLDGLHRLVPEYQNGAADSQPAAASRQA